MKKAEAQRKRAWRELARLARQGQRGSAAYIEAELKAAQADARLQRAKVGAR